LGNDNSFLNKDLINTVVVAAARERKKKNKKKRKLSRNGLLFDELSGVVS
jgi:hypothetical protein